MRAATRLCIKLAQVCAAQTSAEHLHNITSMSNLHWNIQSDSRTAGFCVSCAPTIGVGNIAYLSTAPDPSVTFGSTNCTLLSIDEAFVTLDKNFCSSVAGSRYSKWDNGGIAW